VSDVVPFYLRLPAHEIAYVKFLFESYEGVGLVRTIDRDRATLVALVVPDFLPAARALIASLVAEGVCEETGPPANWDGDWLG
jgi:hypothetical protein